MDLTSKKLEAEFQHADFELNHVAHTLENEISKIPLTTKTGEKINVMVVLNNLYNLENEAQTVLQEANNTRKQLDEVRENNESQFKRIQDCYQELMKNVT